MAEYTGTMNPTSPWAGGTMAADFKLLLDHVLSQGANATRPTNLAAGGVWAEDLGGGNYALKMFDGTNDFTLFSMLTGIASGGIVGVKVFGAAGAATYTKTDGVSRAIVGLIAGAGGGGDGDSDGDDVGFGQGGGKGQEDWFLLDLSSVSTATLSIGAGGAGGATAGANGSNGGDTTWSDGTHSMTVKGGPGGRGVQDKTGAWASVYADAVTDNDNSATPGFLLSIPSSRGRQGFGIPSPAVTGTGMSVGGDGTAGAFGLIGFGAAANLNGGSNPGRNGGGYNGGGGGGATLDAATHAVGGDGSGGAVIVIELAG